MIRIHTAERVEPLAERLADVLSAVPADPMTNEWVAVPSSGMQRWLSLELARHLGAGSTDTGDGVAANIEFAFPGSLRNRILDADRPDADPDPWRVDRLTWAILDVADRHPADPPLAALTMTPDGGSRYSTARRVADMFDRYHVHRPDMIRQWAEGQMVDGSNRSLPEHQMWQPRLWALLRDRLAAWSPPERLPDLLERLRRGELPIDLPERLALFGLTALPGGDGFIDLAQAVGATRDLHLFLLEPSTALAERISSTPATPVNGHRLRSDDHTADDVAHPLLRSWGRMNRETVVLLADARTKGLPSPERLTLDADIAGSSLLAILQDDIRANREPAGDWRPDPADRSIQFHACHGTTRQVEVLRDAILHLLADPALGLTEDDVVVVCPALEQVAPIVEAVFGPSAGGGSVALPVDDEHPPSLRYRIADRSIGTTNPVLEATTALQELVGGRFEAPAVLDFAALGPVRERFRFSDDDLARLTEWAHATNVRWGLDGQHREPLGVPESITNNTWRAAIDRILVGAAVLGDGLSLAVGDVVPCDVEGDDAELAGRFADLMWRLAELVDQAAIRRPVHEWIDVLRDASAHLFATSNDESWQIRALHRVFRGILEASVIDGEQSSAPLDFVDMRRLLSDQLRNAPGRPDFFRGGITVTSMTPLRWIPYRVVCLLGMEQSALSVSAVDGDDLVAAAPHLGDSDPRGDARQALLEALLAAGDRLVVVRDGHDVRTNRVIPPAVAVAELIDVLAAMIHPDERQEFPRRLEVHHPRQPFDERCFAAGELVAGMDTPWSFDPAARASALARQRRDPTQEEVFLSTPLVRRPPEDVALEDLHRFLRHPVQGFLEQRLKLRLPRLEDGLTAVMPVAMGGLDGWGVGTRLLDALLADRTAGEWAEIEQRIGTLPPGVLGDDALGVVSEEVEQLVALADALGLQRGAGTPHAIAVTLTDGTRVTGTVLSRLHSAAPGPMRVQYSRPKPTHVVAAWVDLIALVANDPTVDWRSVSVTRGPKKGESPEVVDMIPAGALGDAARHALALDALEVAVDCFRRGTSEPIPLFPNLSREVYQGDATSASWPGYGDRSDGNDRANALVFGRYDFDDLMAIAAAEGDPPGPGGRVERYARYLWATIERSTTTRTPNEPAADIASDLIA